MAHGEMVSLGNQRNCQKPPLAAAQFQLLFHHYPSESESSFQNLTSSSADEDDRVSNLNTRPTLNSCRALLGREVGGSARRSQLLHLLRLASRERRVDARQHRRNARACKLVKLDGLLNLNESGSEALTGPSRSVQMQCLRSEADGTAREIIDS
jgi:hypothetical protein